jgi:hypothetical protein|nr:MAG TPA: hypothetical protein [Caudoviricetes sp.]
MKTIIKGKFYDTDTAITIGKFGEEELFRKKRENSSSMTQKLA